MVKILSRFSIFFKQWLAIVLFTALVNFLLSLFIKRIREERVEEDQVQVENLASLREALHEAFPEDEEWNLIFGMTPERSSMPGISLGALRAFTMDDELTDLEENDSLPKL